MFHVWLTQPFEPLFSISAAYRLNRTRISAGCASSSASTIGLCTATVQGIGNIPKMRYSGKIS
jgi:hypothetical protein